ncbi:hypothetical protein [Collinsella aerofaciens]|uniref:hypothetical protein n=1 Tax=Collinsella aerofaciens TaxID=74426 RepID=UPI003D7A9442
MFLVLRYAFLVLFLATVVSLIPMFIPDPKSSDRRFHLYVGSVVAAGAIVCSLFQALAPMSFKVIGEKDEVVETHSLVTLNTDSCLSGSSSLLFGYLTEEDVYVLMVRQDDGGYRRKCYSADSVVVYEDVDVDDARVDTVKCNSTIRCTYWFPIIGEWQRDFCDTGDFCNTNKQEVRIHVPKGSIVQGEYDFQ